MDGGEEQGRAHARARVEAVLLGLLAALPLLVLARRLAEVGIPRFAIDGDYALLESATRMVPSGKTLLGPYSRFHFNHPGPLYFYVLWPIYWLSGKTTAGLYAGAIFIHGASIAVLVGALRLLASRAHALAGALVALATLSAFGNVCFEPWNPMVIMTPLLAFLVLAALVVAGAARALPWCAFFGVFVVETHVASVPVVGVVGLVVTAALLRRARSGLRALRGHLLTAAAVLVLAVLPIAIEQATSSPGNLTKLVQFFRGSAEPPVPLGRASAQWVHAASWLPDRLLSQTLRSESAPIVMASQPVSESPSRTARTLAVLWLSASVAALAIAWRRRDRVSAALVAIGLVASAISVLALRSVVGHTFTYLVFWTTAASTTAWLGVASGLLVAAAPVVVRRLRLSPRLAHATASLCLVAMTLATTSTLATWMKRNRLSAEANPLVRETYENVLSHLRRTGETAVIHPEAMWMLSAVFLDELGRDGMPVAIAMRDRWMFGAQFPLPSRVERPLHLYPHSWAAPLPTPVCPPVIVTSVQFIEVRGSPVDELVCPAR